MGCYVVAVAEPDESSATPPVQVTPVPQPEAAWVARARVNLASVNRQLDLIAATEEAWSRLPSRAQAAAPAAPVEALRERKDVLEGRRTALQSQIDVYESLGDAQQQVTLSEQHLAAVDRVLADAPPQSDRTPEQAAAIGLLLDQRDVHMQQRDHALEAVATLEKGVETAARRHCRTTLPRPSRSTTRSSTSSTPRAGATSGRSRARASPRL